MSSEEEIGSCLDFVSASASVSDFSIFSVQASEDGM